PPFPPRGFKRALVAPLARGAIQVHVPGQRFAALAGQTNAVKRENETVRPGIGKAQEPNCKRTACAIGERDDSSCTTLGLRPRDNNFPLGNRALLPAQRQIAPMKGSARLHRRILSSSSSERARPESVLFPQKTNATGERHPATAMFVDLPQRRDFTVDRSRRKPLA